MNYLYYLNVLNSSNCLFTISQHVDAEQHFFFPSELWNKSLGIRGLEWVNMH